MEKLRTMFATLLVLAIFIGGVGCGGEQKISVLTPTPITAVSAKIGSSGGTIEVTDYLSPLYRVSLKIPSENLAREVTVTVSRAEENPSIPEGSVVVGVGVRLGPEGLVFQQPVSISIPYCGEGINENTIGVYEYNPTDQTLHIGVGWQ